MLISGSTITGEALLLGLVSGPACIASCGPVLVPWLIDQQRGFSSVAGQLATFLVARYAGYLLFATVSWNLGLALPAAGENSVFYAVAHLILAAALVMYALGRWRACAASPVSKTRPLLTIEAAHANAAIGAGAAHWPAGSTGTLAQASSRGWSLLLGFLTGLSLCPPFLVAGVRAAELRSLPSAWGFFSLFFVGTIAWFVPFAVFGSVRWKQPVAWVARMTLFVLAGYYGYIGLIALLGRMLHGR